MRPCIVCGSIPCRCSAPTMPHVPLEDLAPPDPAMSCPDAQSLMAVLGHSTITQAAHYSKAYDRARSADAGMAKLAEPAETNVVRLERKDGK